MYVGKGLVLHLVRNGCNVCIYARGVIIIYCLPRTLSYLRYYSDVWDHSNSNIVFYCVNIATAHEINKQPSSDNSLMVIVRPLVLVLIKYNIHFMCKHVPSSLFF